MHRIPVLATACVAAIVLLPGASGLAAPVDDYRAVLADWQQGQDVTPCRFTRPQLLNARNQAGAVPDFDSYAPGFREEVTQEIARHDRGGCRGVSPQTPVSRRERSALRAIRITAIRPRGGSRESVTIRNTSRRAVRLRGATLRDRSGKRIRLSGRLAGRRTLRVLTGCAGARKRPARLGAQLFACRSGRLWDDRGDVVKVVDARGIVVAQRGYGTLRAVTRF
jgi:hypothetical protein